MSRLPRLAIGTVQPGAAALPMLWALSEVFSRRRLHVQHFLSRGCFVPHHGASPGGATTIRHLDSWLMAPDICHELFARGAAECDLALVEGHFERAAHDADCQADAPRIGGDLSALCDWLDLPRLIVLDAGRCDSCRLIASPGAIDGVLLDRVGDAHDWARLQTRIESLWNVPVLGALGELAEERAIIADLPSGVVPPQSLSWDLGDNLERTLRVDRLLEIAAGRPFAPPRTARLRTGAWLDDVTVAVAYDQAFNCYFPDTLDLLELQGASVRVFSPLQDDRLPNDTDVVYLGCGHPERWGAELAANRCMISSLCDHIWQGGRVYAEGGGLAYLCEEVALPGGIRLPMVGALPAVACYSEELPTPVPVEITLAHTNWLGEGWSQLRGYLNSRWNIAPTGPLVSYAAQEGHELDLVGRRQVIGSRLHLNFAAQPEFLRAFFAPHPPAVDVGVG